MIEKFKMAKNEESGYNWLICWTGQDAQGNHFNVTTNFVHGSSLHNYTRGAEGDAELIARLLNWYYTDQNAAEQIVHLTDGGMPPSAGNANRSIKTSRRNLTQRAIDGAKAPRKSKRSTPRK